MLIHLINTLIYPLLFTLPAWVIYRYYSKANNKEGKPINKGRELVLFLFYLYAITVGTITLTPQMDITQAIPGSAFVNIIPIIKSYNRFQNALLCPVNACMYNFFLDLLGNIIMFIPLGFMLPVISAKTRRLKAIFLIALIASASIEMLQYFIGYWNVFRFSDIDDIILNVAGACIGYTIFTAWQHRIYKKPEMAE